METSFKVKYRVARTGEETVERCMVLDFQETEVNSGNDIFCSAYEKLGRRYAPFPITITDIEEFTWKGKK